MRTLLLVLAVVPFTSDCLAQRLYYHDDLARSIDRAADEYEWQQQRNRRAADWHYQSQRSELRRIANSLDDIARQHSPLAATPSGQYGAGTLEQQQFYEGRVAQARERTEAAMTSGVDTRDSTEAWLDKIFIEGEERRQAIEAARQRAVAEAAESQPSVNQSRAMWLRDMRRQRLGR
jgi:hypothetical protein